MNDSKTLDISWETILKVAFASLIFYVIYLVRDILIAFFFALIISFLFDPIIGFLERFRIPRILAVVFIYLLFFGMIGFFIYWTAPVFFNEIQQFSQLFPQYLMKISPFLKDIGIKAFENMETFTVAVGQLLQKASSDILSAISVFFGGITSTLFILSLALFISLEKNGVENFIFLMAPAKYENYILALWKKSEAKVAGWFGSRVLTSLFVAVTFFITLLLFNINYALVLAFLAGILNFIPIIGPIITGGLIIALIGFDSMLKTVFVLIAFTLIQQIEGNIISPILTKRIIGLPPALVLISLAIGGRLLGAMGAILAVPLAGIIFEFLSEFLKETKSAAVET